MADDSQGLQAEQSSSKSRASQAQDGGPTGHRSARPNYEQFTQEVLPPRSANLFPGGTQNTAGGRQRDVTPGEVVSSIKLEDFTKVHRQPCVRDALLTGILGGFLLGGGRAVLGASVMKASNWAVGTFVGTSFVGYEFCQYRRHRSIEGMKMAIEVLDRKKAEMERQRRIAEAEAEARRRTEEEAARLAEEAKKNRGWKFW